MQLEAGTRDTLFDLPFFNDEHRAFQQGVDAFMRREAPLGYALKLEQDGVYPDEAMRKLCEQGFLGVSVPKEYGGMGLDAMYHAIMMETMSRHCDCLAITYSMVTWGITNLIKYGTDAQKAHYLPLALQGRMRFAAGITEPNAGSDAASLSLKATRVGDKYVLNGQKIFTSCAHVPDTTIITFARTDSSGPKHRGITALLVPNTTPGLDIRRLKVLGRTSPGTNEVFYTDVEVPASAVLGEVDQGWKVLTGHLVWERAGLAAQYVGMARLAVDLAIQYAKQRVQFGHPIGHFQAIKHMLANMDAEVEAARLLSYRAAWTAAAGKGSIKEVSEAKLLCTEVLQKVTMEAMQIFGGYGQMPEYHIERLFRAGKLSVIGGGSNEMQRSIIGKELGL